MTESIPTNLQAEATRKLALKALEALKADKQLADVPVIVISAKELTAAERKRLSSQTDMLMQKGDFTDEELLEEILKRAS